MTILKRVGYKTAIPGGFTYFGNYLRNTDSTTYMPTSWRSSRQAHGALCRRGGRRAPQGRTVAACCASSRRSTSPRSRVGDGANDLPMLNLAGLGIAFHAKPKVKATARQSISTIGLDGILISSA